MTETDVVGRLRKYEHLLKSHGVKIEDDDSPEEGSQNGSQNETQDRKSKVANKAAKPHLQPPSALFSDKENSFHVERYSAYPLLTT